MYLVISLVGAADTIVDGNYKARQRNISWKMDSFRYLMTTNDKTKENFTKKGLTVEETFYLDLDKRWK